MIMDDVGPVPGLDPRNLRFGGARPGEEYFSQQWNFKEEAHIGGCTGIQADVPEIHDLIGAATRVDTHGSGPGKPRWSLRMRLRLPRKLGPPFHQDPVISAACLNSRRPYVCRHCRLGVVHRRKSDLPPVEDPVIPIPRLDAHGSGIAGRGVRDFFLFAVIQPVATGRSRRQGIGFCPREHVDDSFIAYRVVSVPHQDSGSERMVRPARGMGRGVPIESDPQRYGTCQGPGPGFHGDPPPVGDGIVTLPRPDPDRFGVIGGGSGIGERIDPEEVFPVVPPRPGGGLGRCGHV